MHATGIICLGLNHRTAALGQREQVTTALTEHYEALREVALRERRGKRGLPTKHGSNDRERKVAKRDLVLLTTCNRVELYSRVEPEAQAPFAQLENFIIGDCCVPAELINCHAYRYMGQEAAIHLCRVSTGLDSLVLGEAQILGQVTDAYQAALDAGLASPVISRLFLSAIRAGKRARKETAIGRNPASIPSLAIAKAQEIVGNLRERRVLVVGLGAMGLLAVKVLRSRGIVHIAVANRNRKRVEAVADRWGCDLYSFAALEEALADADVVISATAATYTVLDQATVGAAMRSRPARPLVLIDIAVPRDIDPAVGELPNVRLFDANELEECLDKTLLLREKEIPRVEAIINEEIRALETEFRELAVAPVIKDLRRKAESIRQRELERTLRHLPGADSETLSHVDHLSRALVNKLLHEPTARLKQEATRGDAAAYAATLRRLFGLGESREEGEGM